MRPFLLRCPALVIPVIMMATNVHAATCSPLYHHPAVEEVIDIHVERALNTRRKDPSIPYNIDANVKILRERINNALSAGYVHNPQYGEPLYRKQALAKQALTNFNFDALIDCFPSYRPVVVEILNRQQSRQQRNASGTRNGMTQGSDIPPVSQAPAPSEPAPSAPVAPAPETPTAPASKTYSETEARTLAVNYEACMKSSGSGCSNEKLALTEMLIRKGISRAEAEQDLPEESARLVKKFMDASEDAYKRCVKATLGPDLSGEAKLAYSCMNEQAAFAKVLSGRGSTLEEVRNKLASVEGTVREEVKTEQEAKRVAMEKAAEEARAQAAFDQKLAEEKEKARRMVEEAQTKTDDAREKEKLLSLPIPECPKAIYGVLFNSIFSSYTIEHVKLDDQLIVLMNNNIKPTDYAVTGNGMTLKGYRDIEVHINLLPDLKKRDYVIIIKKSGTEIDAVKPGPLADMKVEAFMKKLCSLHFKE